MSLAVIASGTLFKIEVDASVGNFVTIPECIKIGAPNCKFDLLDTTSHDSAGFFKEYIPGLSDGENATAEINYVPTNSIHTQIRVDAYARTLKLFKNIFPVPTAGSPGAGATVAFSAYVASFPATADVGQILRATMTAKITGLPAWT